MIDVVFVMHAKSIKQLKKASGSYLRYTFCLIFRTVTSGALDGVLMLHLVMVVEVTQQSNLTRRLENVGTYKGSKTIMYFLEYVSYYESTGAAPCFKWCRAMILFRIKCNGLQMMGCYFSFRKHHGCMHGVMDFLATCKGGLRTRKSDF